MKAKFRVDATQSIGAGHVMRCWALAEELARRGWEIQWEGQIEVDWIAHAIERAAWTLHCMDPLDAHQPGPSAADVVVVDSYLPTSGYRSAVIERGSYVVAILDDFHESAGPASLWVNPGAPLPPNFAPQAGFLNGLDYLLIRRDIRNLRQYRRRALQPKDQPTLTVLLGGTNSAEMTEVVDLLGDALSGACRVTAGPVSTPERVHHVTWLPAGDDLLRTAALSDLVVSPAGVSSWEMLHIGVPLALFHATQNQRGNYEWITKAGWATPLGGPPNVSGVDSLADAIRRRLVVRGGLATPHFIDGLGAERVADVITAEVP